MLRRVVLYSRPGCHLCDVAREVLLAERARTPFELIETDVEGDDDLEREYGIRIPVVEIDGKVRFRGRVSEVLLRRLIESTPPRNNVSRYDLVQLDVP